MTKVFRILWTGVSKVYVVLSYFVALVYFLIGLVCCLLFLALYYAQAEYFQHKDTPFKKLSDSTKDVYLYLEPEDVGEQTYVGSNVFVERISAALGYPVRNYTSVIELRNVIESAKTDDRIKGIILSTDKYNYQHFSINNEFYKAIADFRTESKKPVYMFSTFYSTADLLLASNVDKAFINDQGYYSLTGFQLSTFFLGDFFKTYGIKDYSFTIGKYSLTNLIGQNGFTEDNMHNVNSIVWKPATAIIEEINKNRKLNLTLEQFDFKNQLALSETFKTDPEKLKSLGLVDETVTMFGWSDFIRATAGIDEETKAPKIVTLNDYLSDVYARAEEKSAENKKKDYYLTYTYDGLLSADDIDANAIAQELLALTKLKYDEEYNKQYQDKNKAPATEEESADKAVAAVRAGDDEEKPEQEPEQDKQQAVEPEANAEQVAEGESSEEAKLKGIVLRFNSVGGDIAQAQILYDAVRQVTESGVPVVVLVNDTLTGATFMGLQSANAIVADRHSVVGGLDVHSVLYDVTDTLRAFYNMNPSYFRGSKLSAVGGDLPFPFSELQFGYTNALATPEFVDYRKLVAGNYYRQMVQAVADSRGFTYDQADELSQGKVFTAPDALQAKLIDRVGDLDEAYAVLDELNKQLDAKFDPSQIYKRQGDIMVPTNESLLGTFSSELASIQAYKFRNSYNLSQARFDALQFTLNHNNPDAGLVSVCFACDNKPTPRNVAPYERTRFDYYQRNPLVRFGFN